jgi:hypothetical protein|tara:strand:+ start:1290 stop:1577 length:288 start_codon:yes stop_codon:yes gene_type:complete
MKTCNNTILHAAHEVYSGEMAAWFRAASDGIDVGAAVEDDIIKQGGDVDNPARVARAAVREIRSTGDALFKSAGVDPKFHKANFIKVIDEIMKGL